VNLRWQLRGQRCCTRSVMVMVVMRCALDVMVVVYRLY
jgi:hypothetical protein